MAEEEDHVCDEGAPAWMATFGDLMSLLFVFFVLLLSFANTDVVKFKEALGSMRDAFGVQVEQPGDYQARSNTIVEFSQKQSSEVVDGLDAKKPKAEGGQANAQDDAMMREVHRLIREGENEQWVSAARERRGVVLRVRGQMIFSPGSDQLRAESLVFLDSVAQITKRFPYTVAIEGHTDDQPVRSDRFPTNWHLASARAIAVLDYLRSAGGIPGERLSATSYADQRPIVPNDSESHRAINRRVEFVYSRESFEQQVENTPLLAPQ